MSTPSPRSPLPLPTGRGWWLVAAAIAAGMAVFLVLWLGQRDSAAPYRADEQPPAAAAPVFKPLPAPPATGSGGGSRQPAATPASSARLEEAAPPPAAVTPGDGVAGAPPAPVAATPRELSASSPVPIESPGPNYPARALRRGESGEVLLRIQVDARGVPATVEVASSSGSRDLDRAAVAAARRWRFRPAMRDGSPVAGVVNVPITFDNRR